MTDSRHLLSIFTAPPNFNEMVNEKTECLPPTPLDSLSIQFNKGIACAILQHRDLLDPVS